MRKRKIMAIWIILLLVAIHFSIAQASETTTEDNGTIPVEIASIDSDGFLTSETFFLSESEIAELESTFAALAEQIENINDLGTIREIIEEFLKGNGGIIYNIFQFFTKFKLSKSRAFVISSGQGYCFNPLKKSSFKIRKTVAFWHYSSEGLFKGRTLILQPFALKMKYLRGTQFGFMTKFTGIYIFIHRNLPEKSYTFFMGTARRIMGMDLTFGR